MICVVLSLVLLVSAFSDERLVINVAPARDLQKYFTFQQSWLGADVATSIYSNAMKKGIWLWGDTLVWAMWMRFVSCL
jgi:hypothetical protein